MSAKFKKYLESNDLSKVMTEAIGEAYKTLCTAVNVKDFDDIHICEKIVANRREFFSLWAFTDKIFCRIVIGKGTDTENKIVIFNIKGNIIRIAITHYNFDLKNPTTDSNLEYTIKTQGMTVPYFLAASGLNCSNLTHVVNKYFLSDLIR